MFPQYNNPLVTGIPKNAHGSHQGVATRYRVSVASRPTEHCSGYHQWSDGRTVTQLVGSFVPGAGANTEGQSNLPLTKRCAVANHIQHVPVTQLAAALFQPNSRVSRYGSFR